MPKKIRCLSSRKGIKNKEKTEVIQELRQKFDLNFLLKTFNISSSSYYYNLKAINYKKESEKEIVKMIKEIFYSHKQRYGYRRITLELRKTITINHKKVKRIMKEEGLFASKPIKKYISFKGDTNKKIKNLFLEKRNNVFIRNFETTAPNQKWGTDVTEFNIKGKKLYLSILIDFNTREIISYSMGLSPNLDLIMTMLEKAFIKDIKYDRLIIHSDQGWQYKHPKYMKYLFSKNIKQSMSRKGNCLDNSPTENFFGILKKELFYKNDINENKFESIEELKKEIKEYIKYYNERRIILKLKGLTPIEYRNQSLNRPIL